MSDPQPSRAAALPTLRAIHASLPAFRALQPHIPVPRIGQLDTELLDEELAQVLQAPLVGAFERIRPDWRGLFTLELGLLIRAILYKFSIWDTSASYGASLQGLRLTDVRSPSNPRTIRRPKLLLHALLTLLLPYAHARLRAHALSHAWPDRPARDTRRRAWRWLTRAENTHAALGLAGFVAFLWDGRYRTLGDRALGLRLVSSRPASRVVSYEYMNRQMVWHAMTEFLLFLVPLVDISALRRRLRQYLLSLRKSPWLPRPLASLLAQDPSASSAKAEKAGPYASLPPAECAICAQRAALPSLSYPLANQLSATASMVGGGASVPAFPVQTPYVTSCGHVYCYVCLTEQMVAAADEGEEGWKCLRCSEVVNSAARLKADDSEGGDADEEDLGDPDLAPAAEAD